MASKSRRPARVPKAAVAPSSKRPRKQPHVKDASATSLRPAAQRVAAYLARSEWLPVGNPYRVNGGLAYEKALSITQDRELEDYLVAAVPLHCMDGWAYLARALQAQIAGDSGRAVHLAYYAELRGALSLLGSRGIGVLNNEHVIVHSNGDLHKYTGKGTHMFAWYALDQWANTSDSAAVLGETIKYQGVSLNEWLAHAQFVGVRIALATEWFISWGADLRLFGRDRKARNLYSYSPNALTNPSEAAVQTVDSQLRGFWEAFVPAGGNAFGNLDQYLIRGALRSAARGRGGKYAEVMEIAVNSAIKGLGLESATGDLTRRFLLPAPDTPEFPDAWLLGRLSDNPVGSSEAIAPGIIARATLLLRLATSVSRGLVDDGNWSPVFGFWIDRFGSQSGLWDPSAPPTALADLRADIDVALDDLRSWLTSVPTPATKSLWQQANAQQLRMLSAAQLVGLWGLAG
jgi:hypothetical protein